MSRDAWGHQVASHGQRGSQGRMGRGTVGLLAEPLGTAGVNEVPKVLRQANLGSGVRWDKAEVRGDFNIRVEYPLLGLRIAWVRNGACRHQRSGGCGKGSRMSHVVLLQGPEQ